METLQTPNSEQWKLYHFIQERSSNGLKTTIKDISEAFPESYPFRDASGNHSNCPKVYEDIDFLNSQPKLKIIVKKRNNFFIPNKEEAEAYYKKLFYKGLAYLDKANAIQDKIELHDQGVFLDREGNVISENSKAKTVIESYVNGD